MCNRNYPNVKCFSHLLFSSLLTLFMLSTVLISINHCFHFWSIFLFSNHLCFRVLTTPSSRENIAYMKSYESIPTQYENRRKQTRSARKHRQVKGSGYEYAPFILSSHDFIPSANNFTPWFSDKRRRPYRKV